MKKTDKEIIMGFVEWAKNRRLSAYDTEVLVKEYLSSIGSAKSDETEWVNAPDYGQVKVQEPAIFNRVVENTPSSISSIKKEFEEKFGTRKITLVDGKKVPVVNIYELPIIWNFFEPYLKDFGKEGK